VRINLALQGGGTHGAFTWGVLDQLLDEADLEPAWLSGTSAGAVNAVALASGLATDGRDGARATLRAVWESVIEAGVPDLLRLNPLLYGFTRSAAAGQMASLFSPYDLNPLGFDPLRQILERHIDFAAVRRHDGLELLVAATDVATGRARLFRRPEMSVEAVLASTCLPTLNRAVEIEGRAYWDGGFSANPDLMTLATLAPVADTLIVQLGQVEKVGVPRAARDIAADVNRITFGQPLLRDVAEIVALRREASRRWLLPARGLGGILLRHRFHLVEAGRHTASLAPDSKLRPDRGLLMGLFAAGREETRRWLARHRDDIGQRETVDLADRFLGPLGPTARARSPQRSPDDAQVDER
jgi:NTE family protein